MSARCRARLGTRRHIQMLPHAKGLPGEATTPTCCTLLSACATSLCDVHHLLANAWHSSTAVRAGNSRAAGPTGERQPAYA